MSAKVIDFCRGSLPSSQIPFKPLLAMPFRDRAIIELDSVDSTNNYAANLIKLSSTPDGTVITAQEQTQGRGQRGTQWMAKKGDNLLFSIIVFPQFISPDEMFLLSQITALAVHDTVEEICQTDVAIKWPNDIIVEDKKICGILIENNWSDFKVQSSIIGVGLNVNQNHFPYPKATSIKQLVNQYLPTSTVLKVLLLHFDKWYELLKSGKKTFVRQRYQSYLYRLNQPCEFIYDNEKIKATIINVETGGLLVLQNNDKGIFKADLKQIVMLY
ncbi:MAG: biotin--[acetyl-CoA-carboxylase] ligase [Flavobacteriales bacterium]